MARDRTWRSFKAVHEGPPTPGPLPHILTALFFVAVGALGGWAILAKFRIGELFKRYLPQFADAVFWGAIGLGALLGFLGYCAARYGCKKYDESRE